MNKSTVFRRVALIVTCAALIAISCLFSGVRYFSASTSHDGNAERALNNCVSYCQGRDFDTALSGKVTAHVFGVPYSQSVTGERIVRGDSVVDRAESASAFVKAAIKKTYSEGRYFICKGEHKRKEVMYAEPKELSMDEYISSYGKPFLGLLKYELSGAITGSKQISDNEYEYTLDPSRATMYSRNEVKTALGGKSYPTYESVTVKLFTDGERPVKVTAYEKLRVEKFGGTKCTAEYIETFSFVN